MDSKHPIRGKGKPVIFAKKQDTRIEDDRQLQVSKELVAGLKKSLEHLKQQTEMHPSWQSVFSSGPEEDIKRLEADIQEYEALQGKK